jgi:hypothetical protein
MFAQERAALLFSARAMARTPSPNSTLYAALAAGAPWARRTMPALP